MKEKEAAGDVKDNWENGESEGHQKSVPDSAKCW